MPYLPESAERRIPKNEGPIYEYQRTRLRKLLSPDSGLGDLLGTYLKATSIVYDAYVVARVVPHYDVGPTGRKSQVGWVVYPDRVEAVDGLCVPDVITFPDVRCSPKVNDIIVTARTGGTFDPRLSHVSIIHPVSPVAEQAYFSRLCTPVKQVQRNGISLSETVRNIARAVGVNIRG